MKLSTPLTTDSEHWITMSGSHLLIDGEGAVLGGAGGKFAGKKLDRVTKKGPDRTAPKGGGSSSGGAGSGGGSGAKVQSSNRPRHSSVKEDHHELENHIPILRETEKAVQIENPVYKNAKIQEAQGLEVEEEGQGALARKEENLWLPKSQISTSGNSVTGVAPFVGRRERLETREGIKETQEKVGGKKARMYALAEKSGATGINPYMSANQMEKALKDQGIQVD